ILRPNQEEAEISVAGTIRIRAIVDGIEAAHVLSLKLESGQLAERREAQLGADFHHVIVEIPIGILHHIHCSEHLHWHNSGCGQADAFAKLYVTNHVMVITAVETDVFIRVTGKMDAALTAVRGISKRYTPLLEPVESRTVIRHSMSLAANQANGSPSLSIEVHSMTQDCALHAERKDSRVVGEDLRQRAARRPGVSCETQTNIGLEIPAGPQSDLGI